MPDKLGNIIEVFPSVQGEGYQMGVMQLFVRFAGCNLHCRFCDTASSWDIPKQFPIYPWPGGRQILLANPVSPDRLFETIDQMYPLKAFHSISFTGGEPLYQHEFILPLMEKFHQSGKKIFVESNGTLPDEIKTLMDKVSFWSLDLKLSRAWGIKGAVIGKHRKCLQLLPPSKTYLKLVLDSNDDPNEILEDLSKIPISEFAVALQPFYDGGISHFDWDCNSILEWIALLTPIFAQVRWIPQIHKLLRIP